MLLRHSLYTPLVKFSRLWSIYTISVACPWPPGPARGWPQLFYCFRMSAELATFPENWHLHSFCHLRWPFHLQLVFQSCSSSLFVSWILDSQSPDPCSPCTTGSSLLTYLSLFLVFVIASCS